MPPRVTRGRGHGIGRMGTVNCARLFIQFADDNQRQLARSFADKRFNLAHEFCWHSNRYSGLAVL
ncbi:hypothetical protein V1293_001891 [Bradyrhizobium sp. AZCC 1693]